jgi:hypothetical protein
MHPGYIWAPYIPLITTPTIFDPNKFNPQKGIMTRDGKSSINPKFYGTLGDVK